MSKTLTLERGPLAELKQIALKICRETLAAIDIPSTMRRKLARSGSKIQIDGAALDLSQFKRIFAIAIGKASMAMSRGLSEMLSPDFYVSGIVVAPSIVGVTPEGFRTIIAGHPVPDENSFEAAHAILKLLSGADENTLIFFLLSGGGSALVELPFDPTFTLSDVQELNRLLVTCGASIGEINAVRKHVSAVKGGRLAAAAAAAMKITLGITDVPQGQESALASGPTLPDPTTVRDARRVVHRFGLFPKLPPRVQSRFDWPEMLAETPKPGDPAFARSAFQVLLGREDLFQPAQRAAEAAGLVTVCDDSTDDWPVAEAADFLLKELATLKQANPGRPVAMIADGEVSSPVTGRGIGGRNSAFVLDCVTKIAGQRIAVASVGTDGIDGSSPAAGAVADGATLERARALGLDPAEYFRQSDSHTFFSKLGDAIVTGPTGNNLRDLRILVSE
jgi:hydroxypyruvate reductase